MDSSKTTQLGSHTIGERGSISFRIDEGTYNRVAIPWMAEPAKILSYKYLYVTLSLDTDGGEGVAINLQATNLAALRNLAQFIFQMAEKADSLGIR